MAAAVAGLRCSGSEPSTPTSSAAPRCTFGPSMQLRGVMERDDMTTMKRGTPTDRPGVFRLDVGKYLIRAKARRPDGRLAEVEREIEARNPAEAAAQRIRLRDDLAARLEADRAPSHPTRSDASVSDYATSWLQRRRSKLRPSTRSRYQDAIAKLNVGLGAMRMCDVRHVDVEAWHNALEGAPPTVNAELAIAKAMFREAARDLDLRRSPAIDVTRRPDNRERARQAFSPAELRAVFEALRSREKLRPWYPLTLTLLSTGARFGEASALRWEDLSEAEGTITIRRAHWRGEVAATKTRNVRVVPVLPELVRVLRDHRRELVASEHPNVASGFMFPAERTVLHTQSGPLGKVLRDACTAAGVAPPARLVHALRRGFNDALRVVATGEVVRAMTGHVTPAMTESYSTVQLAEKRVAVRRGLAHVVGPAGGAGPRRSRKT